MTTRLRPWMDLSTKEMLDRAAQAEGLSAAAFLRLLIWKAAGEQHS